MRLHGRGPGGRRDDRTGARGCSRSSAGARASSTSARSTRGRPRIAGGWSRPRSCARCTSRRCSASSAAATTCSPRASGSARRRSAALQVGRSPLAVTSGCGVRDRRMSHDFDVDRHRRRLRRPERGGPADARRRARARARSAGAARRPRHGVSPIARPASSSTTASTCCSAATSRRSRSCATIGALDHVRLQPQLASR